MTYGIRATEFSDYGTNIVITHCQISGDSLYLTWNSLPSIKYYVQGRTDIGSTNWTPVSATITAADTFTTFRLALPSPYHFFRAHEGLVLNPWLPPVRIASITSDANGVLLEWSTPGSNRFRVQWANSLVPPSWNTFTNIVVPTNGVASFRDDGSESGGVGDLRYCRLQELPRSAATAKAQPSRAQGSTEGPQ